MAYAVMCAQENIRTGSALAAHLPSLSIPDVLYMKSFVKCYEGLSISVTTEARRKFTLHRVNMTDILPVAVENNLNIAERLARDNHPSIRVIKECGLHKQMLFSTPVIYKNSKEIIGILIAFDELPEELCPSPGHLLSSNNEQKTGFLTSLFTKSNDVAAIKRGWSLNTPPPATPRSSIERSFEYTIV